ncbi:MAG: cytochrome P450 [Acidimicrobiia bacterium]|nr:cytochrome P450 [Acidimicrobiia bacterium]
MAARREDPRPDLISHLVMAEVDGEPMSDELIERILVLQPVAGIDTTWSSIGAALPVNVARRVTRDVELQGVEIRAGDYVMMTFPIACRDPEKFEAADRVVIDRERNRHVAFGVGIHRCLGSIPIVVG